MLMPVLVLALVLKEPEEEEQTSLSKTQVPCSQSHAWARQTILSSVQKVVAVTGLK